MGERVVVRGRTRQEQGLFVGSSFLNVDSGIILSIREVGTTGRKQATLGSFGRAEVTDG